jgi:uncharacterized membrane protein
MTGAFAGINCWDCVVEVPAFLRVTILGCTLTTTIQPNHASIQVIRKDEMSRMQKLLLSVGLAVILISDIIAAALGSVDWLLWGTMAGVVVCGVSYHLSTRHAIK